MPEAVTEPPIPAKAPKAYCPGCGTDRRTTARGVFWEHARDGRKRATPETRCPYSGKFPDGGPAPRDEGDGLDVLKPHRGGACMAEGKNESPHAGTCEAPERIGAGPGDPPGDPVGEPRPTGGRAPPSPATKVSASWSGARPRSRPACARPAPARATSAMTSAAPSTVASPAGRRRGRRSFLPGRRWTCPVSDL